MDNSVEVQPENSDNIEHSEPEPEKKEYICNECGKIYKSKLGLKYHLKKVHGIENKLKKEIQSSLPDTTIENKGISESEISNDQIEDEKSRFLENLESSNDQLNPEPENENAGKTDFTTKLLENIDYADLYIGAFSIIANLIYKIDIYKYPDLIDRLKRRGKLIKIIADKYINNEDYAILIMLSIDSVDDFMFLLSLKKKEQHTEQKESGKNE